MSLQGKELGRYYGPNDGFNSPCAQCYRVATYIVLLPPEVFKPTPTRVFLADEVKTWGKARRRGIPIYCQRHAYEAAGIPLPT